jgi:hypothetical protein
MMGACTTSFAAALPEGVKVVWELGKAYHEKTATRERICLNGLWRWQPASNAAETTVPPGSWGFFKVPGCWPGITDYMQKDSQTVYSDPDWKNEKLETVSAAWYQREITIPTTWQNRRITISTEYLNSYAAVYLDGNKVGEMRFPGGEVDITAFCHPGGHHLLSMLVIAMPLTGVMLSDRDMVAAQKAQGTVERRGLCGDVYLVSTPRGEHISDVKVDTSVRRGEIVFGVGLQALSANATYTLHAEIRDQDHIVQQFTSEQFKVNDLHDGHMALTEKWKPARLWDINTPQNLYTVQLRLVKVGGKPLDVMPPMRFGFREFWIQGRDFYLNGSRIFLSAVPLDNAQVGAAWASYEGARESLERLKSFGINFVYTHNYDCQPGSHLSFAEILRAADDVGILVALSQPHFSDYDWQAPNAERTNGYARHAAFYVHVAQEHPSVVAYAMSHNATGYDEAINPDKIDGIYEGRDSWARNNVQKALRAEAIVKQLDPTRITYHHDSGNLGALFTRNFYVNFAPPQELSDWFEHWSTHGIKPLFLCEYGVPFSWDWMMYRGWYKGQREWGSAKVPWEVCVAEWDAQFLGDKAYRITDKEAANVLWEANQFRAGNLWYRWDYPYPMGPTNFEDQNLVFAQYITDNWRAYRTWEVSAFSPWEYEMYWRTRPGVDRGRKILPVDWEHLQRPGFSADYVESQYETMNMAFQRTDWLPTVAGQALLRNNAPLLAYIGGKAGRFTSKDHNFLPGETVEKQLILINNSRVTVSCVCQWSFGLPTQVVGRRTIRIPTGTQVRIPLRFVLPSTLASGLYALAATFRFDNDEVQQDAFVVDVAKPVEPVRTTARIALFDPVGETHRLLDSLRVHYKPVESTTNLSGFDVLIIGKGALTLEGHIPDIGRVREGLKVIVFEQTAEVLEQRLGFRVEEYGLRQVFPRVPDHPLLKGLTAENLRDWRGEATIMPSRLKYVLRSLYGPTVKWCGIDVPHVFRCGCQGNVASVLIEKPTRGDFLPLLDGGYSLQYAPLMQYREGKGTVLFCQVDVSGRTETDPIAHRLSHNILQYVCDWKPTPHRKMVYVGDAVGRDHLEAAGFSSGSMGEGVAAAESVLAVGPGGRKQLVNGELENWLNAGGRLLAIGWDDEDIHAPLPFQVMTKKAEHISAFFSPEKSDSWFTGIGPADVYSRDPRVLPLITSGSEVLGDGVLARAENKAVVFCQLVPWQFDPKKQMNLKRTFRRSSYLLTRLMANMGVAASTSLIADFNRPVKTGGTEQRWLDGLYLDTPEEWDDPYRFFGW